MLSDKADRCPHCGFVNNLAVQGQTPPSRNQQGVANDGGGGFYSKKSMMILLCIIASLLFIGVGTFLVKSFLGGESETKEAVADSMPVKDNSVVSEPVVEESIPSSATLVFSTSSDGFVNIRQAPSAKSAILGSLYTGGDGAALLSVHGDWMKVRYGNVEGYVKSRYVTISQASGTSSGSSRPVYYVVIASHENLSNAKAFREQLPDGLDCSPMFSGVAKGKVVYRMCSGIYYSKAQAQREANDLKSFYGINAWIWKSDGQAPCVDRPLGYEGGPVNITPQ